MGQSSCLATAQNKKAATYLVPFFRVAEAFVACLALLFGVALALLADARGAWGLLESQTDFPVKAFAFAADLTCGLITVTLAAFFCLVILVAKDAPANDVSKDCFT